MLNTSIATVLMVLFTTCTITSCKSDTPVTPKELQPDVTKPSGDDRYGIRIVDITPYVNAGDSAVENWLLMNFDTDTVSLAGWKVVDPEPSRSFTWDLTALGVLPPKRSVRFRSDSRAQLNNNGDDIVLIAPTGDTVQRITFGKVTMGEIVKPI